MKKKKNFIPNQMGIYYVKEKTPPKSNVKMPSPGASGKFSMPPVRF